MPDQSIMPQTAASDRGRMHVTLTDEQALVVREALLDLADRHFADAAAYRTGAPGREMAIRRATDTLALSKLFKTAGATLAEAA